MGTYTDLFKLKPDNKVSLTGAIPEKTPETVLVSEQTKAVKANPRTGERVNTRTPEQVNRRTGERVNTRTPERVITRQSYNVYKDQHQRLKRLEAKSAMSGGKPVYMSQMVREALDKYLERKS